MGSLVDDAKEFARTAQHGGRPLGLEGLELLQKLVVDLAEKVESQDDELKRLRSDLASK